MSHRDAPEPDEPALPVAYSDPGRHLVRDLLLRLAPVYGENPAYCVRLALEIAEEYRRAAVPERDQR